MGEAIEAGRRRVAEARERGELGPPPTGPHFGARRQRLIEATLAATWARSGAKWLPILLVNAFVADRQAYGPVAQVFSRRHVPC